MREIEFGEAAFDIILASATLHHLRTDSEWQSMFTKLYRALVPGGALWIFDLVDYELAPVRGRMKERYAAYLDSLKGSEYRKEVFDYVEKEDTPKPLVFQLELLRSVGFRTMEVLHMNSCFAAFGAVK